MAQQQSNTVTISREEYESLLASRRYVSVPPEQFLELKTKYGLSSKDMAEAIGRTLSRVSELTKSKGASRAVFERVEAQVIEWRKSHPIEQPKAEAE